MENNHPEFEDIRAFYDEDVPSKLWPLVDEPAIEVFMKSFAPDIDMEVFRKQVKSMHTIKEFQTHVVAKMVRILLGEEVNGFRLLPEHVAQSDDRAQQDNANSDDDRILFHFLSLAVGATWGATDIPCI